MKTSILISTLALLGGAMAFAGPSGKGVVVPPPPAPVYGVGWYFGLQGGANVYQNYEGTEHYNYDGTDIALEMTEEVGYFAGIKFGYGFNGGVVKPAIEFDGFYNNTDANLEARIDGEKVASTTGTFESGAFLVNGILRFDTGTRFMPYVGVGAGVWYGQLSDTSMDIEGVGSFDLGDSDSVCDFAAQIVAGFDVFVTERVSLFAEYKFLNYFGADLPVDDPIQQHLVGIGVKFFF